MDKLNKHWPKELDKDKFYVELVNETDKNEANWLGKLGTALAKKMMAQGYKFAYPGWSPGEPRESDWETPDMLDFLRLCAENPDKLAIAIHEYAYDNNMHDVIPYQMGRVSELNAVCVCNGIALPDVLITEWGWSYNQAPHASDAVPQMIDMLHWYQHNAPNVKGVYIWALDKAEAWPHLASTVNSYMTPLLNAINATEWDSQPVHIVHPAHVAHHPHPHPVENVHVHPVHHPDKNYILNPGFEDGWKDHAVHPDRSQVPKGWYLNFTESGDSIAVNQKTGKPSKITGTLEATHKQAKVLPDWQRPDGTNPLVRSGEWTYKLQAVRMVSDSILGQIVTGLEPMMQYKFLIYGKVHYQPNAKSANEPDDIEVWAVAGETTNKYFVRDLPDRSIKWIELEAAGTADHEGKLVVEVAFVTKWRNSRDLFLDDASLTLVNIPEHVVQAPAPTPAHVDTSKVKRVVVKLAQEADKDTWRKAFEYAESHYHRSVTASDDDLERLLEVGNDESYAVVIDPEKASQQRTIAMLNRRGFKYEVLHMEDSKPSPTDDIFVYWPCDSKVITQHFGSRPQVYAKFGLPKGHEGIDFRCPMGSPSYAVQDGVVVEASNKTGSGKISNYGYHVYLKHEVNGQVFHTSYAHGDQDILVEVGDKVKAGDKLISSGNTGFTSGPHLHFSLLWPTSTGNGFPQWRFGYCVNPEPFLKGKNPPVQKHVQHGHSFDIASYVLGGKHQIEVQHPGAGTESVEMQHHGNDYDFVKNRNFERLHLKDGFIWRSIDISPGPAPDYSSRPGDDRWYTQFDAGKKMSKWCPKSMSVGETWVGKPHTVQFFFKSDCHKDAANSGSATNKITFVNHHESKTWNGITVKDVIELKSGTGETFYFAKDYGMVAWESAWGLSGINEIHDGRAALERDTGCWDSVI
jgi:murein DD-endopeptidase MepM/ murein hydrolase activator NlpD